MCGGGKESRVWRVSEALFFHSLHNHFCHSLCVHTSATLQMPSRKDCLKVRIMHISKWLSSLAPLYDGSLLPCLQVRLFGTAINTSGGRTTHRTHQFISNIPPTYSNLVLSPVITAFSQGLRGPSDCSNIPRAGQRGRVAAQFLPCIHGGWKDCVACRTQNESLNLMSWDSAGVEALLVSR